MGVTGLWNVVHPCARPIKIETLNKKRLAVDASIWIYQFLKAVRDKEGNALRNSHVVGFFRRICKLLYLGIKPVFVFDGGAPALKRQTINNRKRRREGRRDDAVKTAGKLLALQMQRVAEEEEAKRRDSSNQHAVDEEPLPENLVYAEEISMTEGERQRNRIFKKQDAYHLPNLDANLAEMGQPNDPRIMSLEELQHYANQFQSGEDINVYDFSKIDFDSPFFTSLPASDRYNILNAARLRSRLRMGYSKEQLDVMFPNRMEFSKFQIERVRERNELTQRLMHINNSEGDLTFGANGLNRVAGEKGREYVLVRNDGVEGGWALGVVSNEGKRERPIDVDAADKVSEEDSDDDMDFEDVPIEGVNRLPRLPAGVKPANDIVRRDAGRRRAFYGSRRRKAKKSKPTAVADPDSLFVQPEVDSEEEGEEWEEVGLPGIGDEDVEMADEDEDVQKAISLSLQQNGEQAESEASDELQDVFEQRKAPDNNPFKRGSGKMIAHVANARANKAAAPTPVQQTKGGAQASKLPQKDNSNDDDSDDDFRAAMVKSRAQPAASAPSVPKPVRSDSPSAAARAAGFDGPLPFEKLNLGASILGKKKMEKIEQDQAGGFEREAAKTEPNKKEEARPLPPWFAGNLDEDMAAQRKLEAEQKERDREAARKEAERKQFEFQSRETLQKHSTQEVIDLDADPSQQPEVIAIDSDEELEDVVEESGLQPLHDNRSPSPIRAPPAMDELAEKIRVEPPQPSVEKQVPISINKEPSRQSAQPIVERKSISREPSREEHFEWEDSDHEADQPRTPADSDGDDEEFEDVTISAPPPEPVKAPEPVKPQLPVVSGLAHQNAPVEVNEAEYDFSDSDDEDLLLQLAQEQEEHARFASTLNNRTVQQNIADYEKELKQLRTQQKKDRRDADEVTQTMITECQQLLGLFGLPYVTAPMEAEAQCAELVKLGLVDGIVTDDSDVFLFGGTRIYKNVFNQAKFVECYLTSDLESEFGLTRHRLISIAQLLGSDYTEGLAGIGPVTALEILSEFDDLAAFRDWWTAVQQGKRAKEADASNAFRKKFRRNVTKVFLPMTFPNPLVENAYLEPEVDSDPSEFVWGVPDLHSLRSFLMSTIGWTNERVDEILVPVIKDMNTRQQEGTQANITAFFGGGVGAGAFAPRRRGEGTSKRLESALHKIGDRSRGETRGEGEQVEDTAVPDKAPARAKKGGNRSKRAAEADSTAEDEEEEFVEPRKKARKTTRRKKGGLLDDL